MAEFPVGFASVADMACRDRGDGEYFARHDQRIHVVCNGKIAAAYTREAVPLRAGEYCHDDFEIIIPLRGTVRMLLGDRQISLATGWLHAINPGQRHAIPEGATASLLHLYLTAPMLQGIAHDLYGADDILLPGEPVSLDGNLGALVQLLKGELEQGADSAQAFIVECLSIQLAIHLLRRLELPSIVGTVTKTKRHEDTIHAAVEYIKVHYAEPINVSDVARITNLSLYHFMRVFKEFLGKTPHEYLQDFRIELARQFLRETDRSITDILFSCGFRNHSHFTKVFKRKLGLSPREYRMRA